MTTSKWYALNHLGHDVAVAGDMDYLSVNANESSHKRTKIAFEQISKRKATAMQRKATTMDKMISRSWNYTVVYAEMSTLEINFKCLQWEYI